MTLAFGLGIDAGGTQTRWALASAHEAIVAEGAVRGMSALQLRSLDTLRAALAELAAAVLPHGRPSRIRAGVTGLGKDVDSLRALIASPFGLAAEAVVLTNDLEIAYLDVFAPGEGYLVYSGTGSIAAFVDADGVFHRSGGRGFIVDDAGSGFWIAREAMRHVWRAEDDKPGTWRGSPLAAALFEHVGGSDWVHSRNFIYDRDRGEIGQLALAVARAAEADPAARRILEAAGGELARLAVSMIHRYGARPVVLAGRAAQLHPVIADSMRAALPDGASLGVKMSRGHYAAARLALEDANIPS
jgi:N-acetylglucosamine kinase-like BadF-type ATPase